MFAHAESMAQNRRKDVTRCPKDSLREQAKGKELEYRIIAVNKAGEGEPGNTEMVVL